MFGYVLEMKNTINTQGLYEVVFDGSDHYPDLRNFLLNNVVAGNNYIFRVKAKYQNGFTDYSSESLPIWACSPVGQLNPVTLVSVSQTSMTLQW